MDALMYLLAAVALAAAFAVTFRVGFSLGKHAPYRSTVRDEVVRRLRLTAVYAKATLAVLSPAYGRRWARQRAADRQAALDRLEPIKRAPWATGADHE